MTHTFLTHPKHVPLTDTFNWCPPPPSKRPNHYLDIASASILAVEIGAALLERHSKHPKTLICTQKINMNCHKIIADVSRSYPFSKKTPFSSVSMYIINFPRNTLSFSKAWLNFDGCHTLTILHIGLPGEMSSQPQNSKPPIFSGSTCCWKWDPDEWNMSSTGMWKPGVGPSSK